ncbi:MAG TPA: PAS domain S-box protein [Bacteroidota bacterium]|nr:PAS domain S-box protein [Bacteroidota bacterium]
MNSEALLSFLITLAEFFLGFFVWLKNPKNESHRLFFAFVACLVLWGLSDAGLRLSENRAAAEMVHKLGAIGFCLFPAVFLHFVSVYTGYGRLMNRSLSYVLLYGGALALTMFHTMGFITEVTITTNGIFSVSHAKGYDAYVVWISLCCLISAVLMVRRYPSSSLPEQKTLLLLAFGLIVVIVAALVVDALIPLYGFRPLITGGFSSLVIVGLFAFVLSKSMVPTVEIVAERVLYATDDLVCVIGQDGYLSYATDVFRRALRLNEGEQLGRIHLRELVEEADRVLKNAPNAMHGPISLEVHFKTRTGSVFPVALSVSQLLDRTKPSGLVLVGRDLSEPRELARKYEESQEKYRNIVESSLDGIVVIQEGLLGFVNPSAVRIFGYENAEEMMRTSFNDTVAPGSKPFMLGEYQRKKIGDDIFRNYEMKGLTKSGTIIDLEINAKLVAWNGKMAVQASFRDITERKNLERDQALWFWEQESLRSIDRQLTAAFELEGVLNIVSRNARAFSRADFSGVILIQESKVYRWRGIKGNRSAVDNRHYLMKGSHRDLIAKGRPTVIHSIVNNPDFPAEDFPVFSTEGLATVALFPFRIKANLEGVLVVGFRTNRSLSEREHRLLSSLADKAAIVIANAELYEDLLEREKELVRLTDARMEAEEAERRRIAREIHDGLGRMLSAIKFNIEVLEDTEGLKEADLKKLLEVKQLLDSVMTEAREISHNLMPSVLEDFGLKPALQLLCESVGKRLGVTISFHAHGVNERLGNTLEINLYRIAQEALNNISKYAQATSATVQLIRDEKGIRLTIEDEGKGFAPPMPKERAEKGGMGLISMRQRASTFGGSLTIESHPGKGTTIMVEIPQTEEQQHGSDQNTPGR